MNLHGLALIMVERVMGAIASIIQIGTAVLLVEQNAGAAPLSQTELYFLRNGKIETSTSADRITAQDLRLN